MATKNTTDPKRFISRAPDKTLRVSLVVDDESTPRRLSNASQSNRMLNRESSQASSPRKVSPISLDTSRNREPSQPQTVPAKRVVVIRNTKNPQINQKPIDLGNFGQPNSARIPPVISNEVNVWIFNRRLH